MRIYAAYVSFQGGKIHSMFFEWLKSSLAAGLVEREGLRWLNLTIPELIEDKKFQMAWNHQVGNLDEIIVLGEFETYWHIGFIFKRASCLSYVSGCFLYESVL